jgi:hypothetical protein
VIDGKFVLPELARTPTQRRHKPFHTGEFTVANIQAVAEYLLEQYGSLDGVKANTNDEAVIAAAQIILDGKNATALPKRFLEIIKAPVTDAEKAEIGAYCQSIGTDGPNLFRLYRIFKALQS